MSREVAFTLVYFSEHRAGVCLAAGKSSAKRKKKSKRSCKAVSGLGHTEDLLQLYQRGGDVLLRQTVAQLIDTASLSVFAIADDVGGTT